MPGGLYISNFLIPQSMKRASSEVDSTPNSDNACHSDSSKLRTNGLLPEIAAKKRKDSPLECISKTEGAEGIIAIISDEEADIIYKKLKAESTSRDTYNVYSYSF